MVDAFPHPVYLTAQQVTRNFDTATKLDPAACRLLITNGFHQRIAPFYEATTTSHTWPRMSRRPAELFATKD